MISVVNSRNWDYSFVTFEKHVFRPDLIDINMKMIRVTRGDYALNGTITYYKDVGKTMEVRFCFSE